jgi:hypothetical protein
MTTATERCDHFKVPDFPSFVLRWLAVVCLAYGLLGLANGVTVLAAVHATHESSLERISILSWGIGVVKAIAFVLAAAGGAGLLARKRWGRTLLLTWALASIGAGLVATIFSVISGLAAVSAGSPPTRDGTSFCAAIWAMLIDLLSRSVFPLLVAGILWHADISVWQER